MHACFDNFDEANYAFLKIKKANVFAWTSLISAYVNEGLGEQALELYRNMCDLDVTPDAHAFVTLLRACAITRNVPYCRWIHAHIVESGLEMDAFVSCSLIDTYSKCGSLQDGHITLGRLPHPNVASWNALIAGYADHGYGDEAVCLFQHMQLDGVEMDKITLLCVLRACARVIALAEGKYIHFHVTESGMDTCHSINNALIDMYIKCGSLKDACALFDDLAQQNVVVWTSLISGCVHHGEDQEALKLFYQMQQKGVQPNEVTLTCMISACSHLSDLDKGMDVHTHIIKSGHEFHLCISSAVIDMYAKCGELCDAQIMFNRLAKSTSGTWNSLIRGYAWHGRIQEALCCFYEMQQRMEVNKVTFACILKACSGILYQEQGQQIHAMIIRDGLSTDAFVGNILIDMYANCQHLQDAQLVFNKMCERSVIAWSTIIMGYVQQGFCPEAFSLFKEMLHVGVKPNQVTFIFILKACSSLAGLEHCKFVHSVIVLNGFEEDISAGSALIDAYAKCGSLKDTQLVFNRLPLHDVVTWSALIGGHALHNDYESAFKYFEAMQKVGVRPDDVTLICLLSASKFACIMDDSCCRLKYVIESYGNHLSEDHCNCIADSFGNAGYLTMAEDLLETAPFQSNVVGWKSLLTSCRRHCNVPVGQRCVHWVSRVEPMSAAVFEIMSSIYTNAGMEKEASSLDDMRKSAMLWKKPGTSFIELGDGLHNFTVGDNTHTFTDKIYAKLKALSLQCASIICDK